MPKFLAFMWYLFCLRKNVGRTSPAPFKFLTNANSTSNLRLLKSSLWMKVPCDQQLFRSRKPLKCFPNLDVQMLWIHGSIFGCIYLFQFKFRKFWRNSAKKATALYVHSPILKTQLRKYDSMKNLLVFFALKID
jgi:hypothetical protein